ncbi:alpha-1-antiproteinase S-like [Eriocheir sinensis]|uniref:alpha-1-antiproteinase S-like n=1 Tax=Eriocheir sinensis TaxID=95602 RepID=UPI0021CAA175|nr:alpha-1-antiproteinase S-like [Eriocheir sinensis]
MEPDTFIIKSAECHIRVKMLLSNLPRPMRTSSAYRRASNQPYPRKIQHHEHPRDYNALLKAEFSFRQPLYQAVSAAWGGAGNLVLSPVVLLLSLGGVYVNSSGETEDELARALRWTRGKEAFRRGAEDLLAALVIPRCHIGYKMSLTSLIFKREGEGEREREGEDDNPYARIADLFQATPAPAPLACPSLARRHMNDAVDRGTKGRMSDLVPEGWVAEEARLVAVSGLYLRGFSMPGFWRYATVFREFWTGVDTCRRVPMLHTRGDFLTYRHPELRAGFLVLVYPEGMYMLLIVPEEANGLASLEAALTPQLVRRAIMKIEPRHTLVAVPKMLLDQTRDYTEVMEHLGVRTLCDPALCQLTGGREGTRLDHLIHRAIMPLDEKSSKHETQDVQEVMKEPDAHFLADRPFHWQVIHYHTSTLLLQGRVTDPAAATQRQQFRGHAANSQEGRE